MDLNEGLKFFFASLISLFAIVNPFGNAPIFLGLTEGKGAQERKRIALRASLTCVITLLAFIFLGKSVLYLFRVSISSFQIAGGILIFIIGLTMLHAFRLWTKSTPKEEEEALVKEDIAVIPLGIPILSGPGAITTAMILVFQHSGFEGKLIVSISALLTSILAYLILSFSGILLKAVGNTGINILTRLMGLLLTVKAIEFITEGVLSAFPFLLNK